MKTFYLFFYFLTLGCFTFILNEMEKNWLTFVLLNYMIFEIKNYYTPEITFYAIKQKIYSNYHKIIYIANMI